jgi:hypothetical protein
MVASDGEDLWVVNSGSNTVTRVHASDGKWLGAWTGATNAFGVVVAQGLIWITGQTSPGNLYVINPAFSPSAAVTVTNSLGNDPLGITTDGTYIWTANDSGTVSRVRMNDYSTTNYVDGLIPPLRGILFDGTHVWVADYGDSSLKQLDSNGNILQSVPTGSGPAFPVFDGSNIWVPNYLDNSVAVVSPTKLITLATFSSTNGLNHPVSAAFDGQRILVTNSQGHLMSLFKSTDLTPIGTINTTDLALGGTNVYDSWGACSDGTNFWVTLRPPVAGNPGVLERL